MVFIYECIGKFFLRLVFSFHSPRWRLRRSRMERYFLIRTKMCLLEANGVLALLFCASHIFGADVVSLNVGNAAQTQQVVIACAVVGARTVQTDQISESLKKALEFTKQCTVQVIFIPALMTKQEAISYKEKNYNYIVFIDLADHKSMIWHLFDIDSGMMQKSKRIAKKGTVMRAWAYALADSIYETLTSEPGFFSTKIAYTKRVPLKKGMHYNHIYIADYDGSHEERLIDTPTVNVAPRWNKDVNRPLLFYSENTTVNMRMMVTDMHKRKIVACNYDGMTMLPAFSSDGKAVMYCSTRGSGSCQLYYWCNKSLKKITNNEGNNFCPTFADFETGKPQIYVCDLNSLAVERITQDGYCVCPQYCAAKKQLVYVKMVDGVMQLFSYDSISKRHQQLTTDRAQKEECSWSPCGNFILCAISQEKMERVAFFDTRTSEYRYLTDSKDSCAYPAWSGVYAEYPVIDNCHC
jgi:tol-pal system beta propeller repeat protein TolB